MTSIGTIRIAARLDATCFLALLVATSIKYSDDSPGGVEVLGPIDGSCSSRTCTWLSPSVRERDGSHRTTLLVLLGAVLPFEGDVVDRWQRAVRVA